ncbi:hypothetical protein DXT88_14780 [Herbaspirillum lusitanum]|uniref:hypothetical protein n=1 Tax=Herbaspirillum lusitanum TaxID=213312 RepID=UPI0022389C66|nr:hypothetical protein [Herbaspirillum lusitanum]MCW5299439.1 hypothetical protein [Herbaspirillum lusitanum]
MVNDQIPPPLKSEEAWLNRHLKILLIVYSAAHLPMLAFFDARFWDDWSLHKAAPETILSVFGQGGSPWVGYLHIAMQQAGGWSYLALTFLAFFVTVVCVFEILMRLSVGASGSFWIAAFVAVLPVNYARIAEISLPSTLALTIFMASWVTLLSSCSNRPFFYRAIALTGFFISFQIGSLIVFFAIPFVTYLYVRWMQEVSKGCRSGLSIILGAADLMALPFVYWYVKSVYFKPSGMFQDGYNVPVLSLETFAKPIFSILDFFSGGGMAIGSGAIVVVMALTFLLGRMSGLCPKFDGKGWKQGLVFILVGILVSYIGVFPYAAVGKLPSFSDWTQTRHQFLLMFGLAITIYGIASCCVRKIKTEAYGAAALIPLFFVLMFIGNWWQIYSEFYVDTLKQRAIVALMKRSPLGAGGNFIILDNTKLSAFSTHTGFGEYAAIHANVSSSHDSLVLDYQAVGEYEGWERFVGAYSKFLGVWSKTERVNLELKPSFYVLNSTVNPDDKIKYSLAMSLMRMFSNKDEAEIVGNLLSLDGPFSTQPRLPR